MQIARFGRRRSASGKLSRIAVLKRRGATTLRIEGVDRVSEVARHGNFVVCCDAHVGSRSWELHIPELCVVQA